MLRRFCQRRTCDFQSKSFLIYINYFRFFAPLCISHFQFHSLISFFIFSMAFEKVLMLLLLVCLALKNSNSSPKSFLFEQDVYGNWRTTFQDIEKSDLVWKYAFQNCRQASKIHKASRLLRSRALIIMLLILGCIKVTLDLLCLLMLVSFRIFFSMNQK